jgi:hypothetical protein
MVQVSAALLSVAREVLQVSVARQLQEHEEQLVFQALLA